MAAVVPKQFVRALAIFWSLLATCAWGFDLDARKLPPPAQRQIDFDKDVRPIFAESCFRCHGPERPKSQFRLDNRETALKGGANGIDIIPGDSAKSPLIHYVARLVPDMEMPPDDKGDPLTPEQVGLLRAWIDQGAKWGQVTNASETTASVSPAFRWFSADGDVHRFREVEGFREGFGGGLEQFSIEQLVGNTSRARVEGHVLFPDEDVSVSLSLIQPDKGFVRGGYDQYRRYYDDTGGYYRPYVEPAFDLHKDLYLTIGRAWVDFGLTLPEWPAMVLGYEYQFKDGDKSLLEWGKVDSRNIYPSAKTISEQTHIVKLDVSYDLKDWRLEDSARVEFYDNRTRRDDVLAYTIGPAADLTTRVREQLTHVQGMNTIHAERQFKDWLFVSAGYLYSVFDGDISLGLDTFDAAGAPASGKFWWAEEIKLRRQMHVASASTLIRPWEPLTLSLGWQGEWQHQEGFGDIHLDEFDPSMLQIFAPAVVQADLDKTRNAENAQLRFTAIPHTVVFASARLEQETISQYEAEIGDVSPAFVRDTDAWNDRRDWRAGFYTSPLRWFEVSAHYRDRRTDNDYDHLRREVDKGDGYSAFITDRATQTDEVFAKLVVRPASWLRAALTYQLQSTDFRTATDPIPGITPGGSILAGTYDASVYGCSLAVSPLPRLRLTAAFTLSDARTVTADNGNEIIVPYDGLIYTVISGGSYSLDDKTLLTLNYSFSRSDFGQKNYAAGLPLGLDYTRHGFMAGITRKLSANLTANLRYAFYDYQEPSTRGINNYTAHGMFATVSYFWK